MNMKTNQFKGKLWIGLGLGILVSLGWMTGCGTSSQARNATPSGFMSDYSQLKPGTDGEALLVYVNPAANFKKYKKIMLDPIRIYAGPDSSIANISKEDQQDLVNYFDATIRENLKKDYTFVNAPGPDVMRLRVAITDAKGSKVALDTVSTVFPIGLAVSGLKKMTVGSHTAVGDVGAEAEGLDSKSNQRLFASVDARVGEKISGKFDKFNKWRVAQDSFDYWAARLQQRLTELRSQNI
jgi:hypothetical protein